MANEPFQILGHDRGIFYFLAKGSGQVVALRSDQMVEGRLVALAPRQWWDAAFPSKAGANWKMAQNSLVQKSYTLGIYNPNRVRGRGAWWDRGLAILHMGDCLIVNGKVEEMASAKNNIYEAAVPIAVNYKNPLTVKESIIFSRVCELISWERPINSRYLAGWCAIAPICGALEWRPHVWITGGAGAGKSFVLEKIVRRIVGEIGLSVQSATTEAGLRQTLRCDARPVLFDEIEGADQRAQIRIQNILELARQASSETGSRIVKGTATGEAVTFAIRSCFAFSSIGVSATSRPDETRITVLGITVDGNKERFAKLATLIGETFTDEYIQRFTARSIKMIPVIRENARIFATAVAAVLGSQRAGDQIGALLAGAYSLHSDNIITASEAAAYIEKQDWSESKASRDDTDEAKCLAFLMQTIVKVPSVGGPVDRSIADLMGIASGRTDSTIAERDAAIATLGLYGMRGDAANMTISISHNAIGKILRDTEWAKTWGRTLKRLPNAKATEWGVRFGSVKNRGIEIPYEGEAPAPKPIEWTEELEAKVNAKLDKKFEEVYEPGTDPELAPAVPVQTVMKMDPEEEEYHEQAHAQAYDNLKDVAEIPY